MITISKCLVDDYIYSSKLKNFCRDHGLRVNENKADALNSIINYAGDKTDAANYIETYQWILNTIKEGSKDFCICKIYLDDDVLENIEIIIKEKYPMCTGKDILTYKNTDTFELVNYHLKRDSNNKIEKISLLFSQLVLEGNIEERGNRIVFPVYIDIYVNEGFIVSRAKPKSKIFECSENDIIYRNARINTINEANKLLESVITKLRLQKIDLNPKQKFYKMAYRLYQKYAVTPNDVIDKMGQVEKVSMDYIKKVFDELDLDYANASKAVEDIKIFLEKYISINGNVEKVFKEDREAYLIRISSDDDLQMTRIDTASKEHQPLQCTDTFYDGKKSILNTQECRRLDLCYNRKRGYLESFLVHLSFKNDIGIIKTHYFPEECDIENVLQTIFENY